MASVTIDLFFVTAEGFEGHVAVTPGEGESGFTLLQSASKALKGAGCQPRPVKSFGGSGGKPAAPPPEKCPECSVTVIIKPWSKEGKNFNIYQCPKDKEHFKPIFKLV